MFKKPFGKEDRNMPAGDPISGQSPSDTAPIEPVEGAVPRVTEIPETKLPVTGSPGFKKAVAIVVLVVLALCLVGAGVAYAIDADNKKNIEYFETHFFDNTQVAGVDVSRMDAVEAATKIQEGLGSVSVEIDDGSHQDVVKGSDISVELKDRADVSKLIEAQDEQAWRDENAKQHSYEVPYKYDDQKLAAFVHGLQCVSGTGRIDPVNASLRVNAGKVEVVPASDGTRADEAALIAAIDGKIAENGGTVDVSKFYAKPRWTGTEPEFQAAREKADKWMTARIDYTIDMVEHAAIVDADDIAGFIDVDNENINVFLNDEKIKEWFGTHTRSFDTVGTERQYTTLSGSTITLSGGHYGWMTDEAAELPLLKASIENGENVTRDFSYVQTAKGPKGGAEWGSTYIDIDITEQVVSYVRNGEVVFSAETVSGNEDPGHETQRGFYSVLMKDSPHLMVGDIDPSTGRPEYETPCTFFILFNSNGSACHDADWRYNWSKSAHYGDGSHGCCNMHYGDVAELWDLCSNNDPVIVHD